MGSVLGASPYEVDPVGDHQIGPRILEGRAADAPQVLLGEFHHAGVDLDHGDLLDRGVLQHLLQHAAVAAADDQHLANRAMGQDGKVGEHLVVDELVLFRGLQDIVQGENPAKGLVLEQHQALVIGLAVVDHLVDPEPDAEVAVQRLLEPVGHIPRPRRCSPTSTREGRKLRFSTSTAL
jgi:hypothetical protein